LCAYIRLEMQIVIFFVLIAGTIALNAHDGKNCKIDVAIVDPCVDEHKVDRSDYPDPHIYSFVPYLDFYKQNVSDSTTLAFPISPKSRAAFCSNIHNYHNITNYYCKEVYRYLWNKYSYLDNKERFQVTVKAMQYPERLIAYLDNFPKFTHQAMLYTVKDSPICSLGYQNAAVPPGDYSGFEISSFYPNVNKIKLEKKSGDFQLMTARMCIEQDVSSTRKVKVYVYQVTQVASNTNFDSRISVASARDLQLLEVIENIPIKQCEPKKCKPLVNNIRTAKKDKCPQCSDQDYLEVPLHEQYNDIGGSIFPEHGCKKCHHEKCNHCKRNNRDEHDNT
jgi:hypothetical protein